MNIHKEKCKRLKAIRKKLADGLGIDLKQRECSFEGECRGTCPKCRQEEEALNRAMLGKAAAVAVSAGILLTGCQGETENTGNPSGRSNIDWEKVFDPDFLKDGNEEELQGKPVPEELPGNMMPPWEEIELDGSIAMSPPEEYELEGATELIGEMPIDYEIAGEETLAPEDESPTIYELAGDIEPGYGESVPVYENEE